MQLTAAYLLPHTGCAENCLIPEQGATLEQEFNCRLSGLPDLNQSNPFVAEELRRWTRWMLDTFPG